jgi:hypothetical protein
MRFTLSKKSLNNTVIIGLSFYICFCLGFGLFKVCNIWLSTPPSTPFLTPTPQLQILQSSTVAVLEIIPEPEIKLKPGQEIYEGYVGKWINVVATAYSPYDPIDGEYHATKGKWRWITADGRTNVKETPYGIAVPLARKNGKKLNKPWHSFGTKVLIPIGYGYLDRKRTNERIFSIDDVGDGKEYTPTKLGKLHIDLRFMSYDSAIEWAGPEGYREIRVFLIEEETN